MKKNKFFVPGLLIVMMALALAVGCKTDSDDDGGAAPTTSGKLTITGLAAKYNGKYAMATGETSGSSLMLSCMKAVSANAGKAVLISNGTVELPVFKYTDAGGATSYTGSDTVQLEVMIFDSAVQMSEETFSTIGDLLIAYAESISVAFTNGIGTMTNPAIIDATP